MKKYPSLVSAKALSDYRIELRYDNGEIRIYPFLSELAHPFYQELKNVQAFQNMNVQHGELFWASGQDFCPNTLYEKSVPI